VRVKVLKVDPVLLADLLRNPWNATSTGFPEDGEIVNVRPAGGLGAPLTIELLVKSGTFPEVDGSEPFPSFDVIFTRRSEAA